MKFCIVCVLLFCFSLSKGQIGNHEDLKKLITILATRIEATSMDNRAFFSLGPKIPIDKKLNHWIGLRGHFNWWDLKDRKFIIIPELDYFYKIVSFEKNKDIIKGFYLGAGITPNAVSPKLGVNFYYFFTAEVGYNLEYKKYKHFPTEGFRFSLGINLF